MSSLIKLGQPVPDNMLLEDMLCGLCHFGAPRVSRKHRGWYAAIDMHVSSVGATFNVASDFDHKTPSEAVKTLIDRVKNTVESLQEK